MTEKVNYHLPGGSNSNLNRGPRKSKSGFLEPVTFYFQGYSDTGSIKTFICTYHEGQFGWVMVWFF